MPKFVSKTSFPNMKDEDWRYTNIASVLRDDFIRGKHTSCADCDMPATITGGSSLVFVNGYYDAEHSRCADLENSAKLQDIKTTKYKVLTDINSEFSDAKYIANNREYFTGGAWIKIPDNVIVLKPIEILCITDTKIDNIGSEIKNQIIVGKNSQVEIVLRHLTRGTGKAFTNIVTEIVVMDDARVTGVQLQEDHDQTSQVNTIYVEQHKNSSFLFHNITMGGRLVRNNLTLVHKGEGCQTNIYGLAKMSAGQHVDNCLVVDHAKPECTSRQLYKYVADGNAVGVFNGKIVVREGAEKTDAVQLNQNLLLSQDASVNSKPQLLIFNDDVSCKHGSSTGDVSKEALEYMQMRGIGIAKAREMLVQAFLADVLDELTIPGLYQYVDNKLNKL